MSNKPKHVVSMAMTGGDPSHRCMVCSRDWTPTQVELTRCVETYEEQSGRKLNPVVNKNDWARKGIAVCPRCTGHNFLG